MLSTGRHDTPNSILLLSLIAYEASGRHAGQAIDTPELEIRIIWFTCVQIIDDDDRTIRASRERGS